MSDINDYLNSLSRLATSDAINHRKNEDMYKYNMDYRRFYDYAKTPDVILPTPVVINEPIIFSDFTPVIMNEPVILPEIHLPIINEPLIFPDLDNKPRNKKFGSF